MSRNNRGRAPGRPPARITWATTPAIRQRIACGEVFDIVIASDAALDDFTQQQSEIAFGAHGIA